MSSMRWIGVLLLACSSVVVAQTRTVAITFDDLPCANCTSYVQGGTPDRSLMVDTNERILTGLLRAQAPATGFVITGGVEKAGVGGRNILDLWLAAGMDLGSHSFSHPDFADVSLQQMEADVARADGMLRPLLTVNGRTLEFFRFPYNDTGDTEAKHEGMAAFLRARGYHVATCTIDTSDYLYAAAYARAVGATNLELARRIRAEYLAYSATEIDFYAALNRRVLGYEPPEVMLLHDSLLNADSIDQLLGLFRERGYHFVTLAAAQRDAAYTGPETYVTRYGVMWGYRWAKERNLGPLGMHETDPPDWITRYANGGPPPESTGVVAGAGS